MAIAPTATISIIWHHAHRIEPIFEIERSEEHGRPVQVVPIPCVRYGRPTCSKTV